MSRLSKSIFTLPLIAALTACGGGGGSSDEEVVSLTGVAIDGYLGQATVCLDLNSNSSCDPGEPTATTAVDGTYTISGITQTQIDNSPVVVQAIASTTTDSDLDNSVIPDSYTLLSPAGKGEVISPLTTMLYNKIQEGFTDDEAKSLLGSVLFSVSEDESLDLITGDFIAQDSTQADEAHLVAQTLARLIAKLFSEFEVDTKLEEEKALLKEAIVEAVSLSFRSVTAAIKTQQYNTLDDVNELVNSELVEIKNTAPLSYEVDEIVALQQSKRNLRQTLNVLSKDETLSLLTGSCFLH